MKKQKNSAEEYRASLTPKQRAMLERIEARNQKCRERKMSYDKLLHGLSQEELAVYVKLEKMEKYRHAGLRRAELIGPERCHEYALNAVTRRWKEHPHLHDIPGHGMLTTRQISELSGVSLIGIQGRVAIGEKGLDLIRPKSQRKNKKPVLPNVGKSGELPCP